MKNLTVTILCLTSLTLLSGCVSHESRYNNDGYSAHHVHSDMRHEERYGTVSNIELLTVESRPSGGGAILGAVIGGVVGHQMGSGRGNDVATGIGALGGAAAGNQIEKRGANDSEIYRVTVRFDSGRMQAFDYKDVGDLRPGDHVKVEHGEIYQL